MPRASILRQLSDADLDALHHKLRRDAETDAQLWAWAAQRLQKSEVGGQKSEVGGQKSEVGGQKSDLGPLTSDLSSDLGPRTSDLSSDLGPRTSDLSPAAGAMVICRYRAGKEFQEWKTRRENAEADLAKTIALQRERIEAMKDLVAGSSGDGIYQASQHLQARLVMLATEATDQELMSGDVKFLKGLLREIREGEALMRRDQVAALKAEIARLMSGEGGERPTGEQVVAAVDKIMGLSQ